MSFSRIFFIAVSLLFTGVSKVTAEQEVSKLKAKECSMVITVSNDIVKIKLSPINSTLMMKRSIEFKVDNIVKFTVSKKPPKKDGFRIFGMYIPFLTRMGVFYSPLNRDWEYWDVNYLKDGFYCVFYLKNEPYKRVIVKTNNDRIINEMKALENSKYWDFEETQTTSIDKAVESSNHEFSARIVLPLKNKEPKTGILFIQGSGPTDKDWNSPSLKGKNGSGKAIAELLAREGYAILTFDKIGTPGNTYVGPVSWSDYLRDQKAALAFLKKEVPSIEHIFILGHSEGTIHALKLFESEKRDQIDGLILLAPTGRTLQDIILSQVTHQINKIPLLSRESKDRSLEEFARGLDSIGEGKPLTSRDLELPFYLKKLYDVFCRRDVLKYSEEIFKYDPKEHLANIDKPVLLIGAGKDQQAIFEKDTLALYQSGLEQGQGNITMKVIKNANHVFKFEEKPLEKLGVLDALAYNKDAKAINVEVIEAITNWFEKNQIK